MYSCQLLCGAFACFGGAPVCVGGRVHVYSCCHMHGKVWLGLSCGGFVPNFQRVAFCCVSLSATLVFECWLMEAQLQVCCAVASKPQAASCCYHRLRMKMFRPCSCSMLESEHLDCAAGWLCVLCLLWLRVSCSCVLLDVCAERVCALDVAQMLAAFVARSPGWQMPSGVLASARWRVWVGDVCGMDLPRDLHGWSRGLREELHSCRTTQELQIQAPTQRGAACACLRHLLLQTQHAVC